MIEITKEMVYKLNERLADGGYALRFKHKVIDLDASSTSPASHSLPPPIISSACSNIAQQQGLEKLQHQYRRRPVRTNSMLVPH